MDKKSNASVSSKPQKEDEQSQENLNNLSKNSQQNKEFSRKSSQNNEENQNQEVYHNSQVKENNADLLEENAQPLFKSGTFCDFFIFYCFFS